MCHVLGVSSGCIAWGGGPGLVCLLHQAPCLVLCCAVMCGDLRLQRINELAGHRAAMLGLHMVESGGPGGACQLLSSDKAGVFKVSSLSILFFFKAWSHCMKGCVALWYGSLCR